MKLKYYLCLFKLVGHTTYHGTFGRSVDEIMSSVDKTKITSKKFYEIDRLTGKIEEF